MKLSIDTDVLQKYNLSLEQFLVMLLSYFNVDYHQTAEDLAKTGILNKHLFQKDSLIYSDNTRNLITQILTESSPKLQISPIKDFDALALKLRDLYPKGLKDGTTYTWQGTPEEIAQKLRVLVVEHNFIYTEAEALKAANEYVTSFGEDKTHMKLLKYFLLRTQNNEICSDFMTLIENSRDENNNR